MEKFRIDAILFTMQLAIRTIYSFDSYYSVYIISVADLRFHKPSNQDSVIFSHQQANSNKWHLIQIGDFYWHGTYRGPLCRQRNRPAAYRCHLTKGTESFESDHKFETYLGVQAFGDLQMAPEGRRGANEPYWPLELVGCPDVTRCWSKRRRTWKERTNE